MIDVLIVGIFVGIGYWIVSPFLGSAYSEVLNDSDVDQTLRQLEARKENILSAIKELEFDLNLGKISMEDYEELAAQYTREAVACTREIEELKTSSEREHETKLIAEMAREISNQEKMTDCFCTQCGNPVSSEDRFCSKCGKLLKINMKRESGIRGKVSVG